MENLKKFVTVLKEDEYRRQDIGFSGLNNYLNFKRCLECNIFFLILFIEYNY